MFDPQKRDVVFYLNVAVATYFLYAIYSIGNYSYNRCIGYIYDPDALGLITEYIVNTFFASTLTIGATIVFWKSYFIKYKDEGVFENIHLKAFASTIVLLVLISLTFNYAIKFLFTLTTCILLMKRFKLEGLVLDEALAK